MAAKNTKNNNSKVYNLSEEMKNILEQRLQEGESTYISADKSLQLLFAYLELKKLATIF